MADELIDAPSGADEQVSAPDLRETIIAAVAKQREEVPAEKVAPEVKSEPEVKPEAKADGERVRDESGRFAPKGEPAKEEVAKPETAPVDAKEAAPADAPAQALRPPTSWSPTAKVAFEKLPPEVQQAVSKREEEVNNGFAKFQEYKPIERYMEMAKQGGTTLDKALERYIGIEQQIGRDMVGGVAQIAQNQGIHPVALANQILARYGASPQQDGTGTTQAHQTAPSVDLTPITQKLHALETYFQQQQQAGVQTEIQRFASDPKHTFFENVKVDMGRLMQSGQADTLDDAYDKACWANKEIRELLIKQQSPVVASVKSADAVQRARAADKATGGAPSPGFTQAPAAKAGASIRDTIRAAVEAQRGI